MIPALLAAALIAAPQPPRPARVMTDAQILGLVAQVDVAEIEEAKLALTKTRTPAVRTFAEMLVTDHEHSLAAGKKLAREIKVTPAINPDTSMAKDHDAEMVKLKGLSGASFDKEFASDMANGHAKVIDQVKSDLIPQATNATLKAHLEALLPTLQKHEDRAKSLEK